MSGLKEEEVESIRDDEKEDDILHALAENAARGPTALMCSVGDTTPTLGMSGMSFSSQGEGMELGEDGMGPTLQFRSIANINAVAPALDDLDSAELPLRIPGMRSYSPESDDMAELNLPAVETLHRSDGGSEGRSTSPSWLSRLLRSDNVPRWMTQQLGDHRV